MVGRITSVPDLLFKGAQHRVVQEGAALHDDVLAQIPSAIAARMTLYRAFLTTLMDRPAEMSSTVAPSFCACLTEEFMNTVQREPRSTGSIRKQAEFCKILNGSSPAHPQRSGETSRSRRNRPR